MTVAVQDAAPAQGWDFGAYPYALEPLALPEPGARVRGTGGGADELAAELGELGQLSADHALPLPTSPEELFWFRWITGHQAVFALWQLLDDELDLVVNDSVERAASRAGTLMDAYSSLLVYTASQPRSVYDRLVRPAMMLQHRMFSGRWAQDYAPIPPRLRTLRARFRRNTAAPAGIAELNRAGKLNHALHMVIANKLVPNGESLLREGDAAAFGSPSEETTRLYDAFFATHRTLVPRSEVVAQLLRRLRAILLDLHRNGLYPEQWCDAAEIPEKLSSGELAVFSDRMVPILIEAGQTAAFPRR